MTVTMKDIARKAGVSRQAVSAALGAAQSSIRVSEETRWRVNKVAQDLGYRPNSAAKVMATGKFGCVAMLTSPDGTLSTAPPLFQRGVHDELNKHNLHMLSAMLPYNHAELNEFMPKFLREWMIDGVLVNYVSEIPPLMQAALDSREQPCVWINIDKPHDAVRPDDYAAAREITRRLIELGHTRIAYAVHRTTHYSATMRQLGYEHELAAANLDTMVVKHVLGSSGWVELGRQWLTNSDRPTAIVAYDAFTARPLLFAALMEGLNVPADLSIATFDVENAEDLTSGITITSMLVPWYSMGAAAVATLVRKIETPSLSFDVQLLPFEFNPGETITCP